MFWKRPSSEEPITRYVDTPLRSPMTSYFGQATR